MEYIQQQTDEELVKLALSQKEFFGALVARYEQPLTRYLRRLGVYDADDISDVLQEIFIKVYRNLNDFDTSLKFSSWIYRIAHNEAISWFRKRNVRPEGHLVQDSEQVLLFTQSEEWDNETKFDAHLNAAELDTALSQLDQKYRDVVILRFFEHKDYEEISDILKIPVNSVGTLLHRAKKQLETIINTEKMSL